MKWEDEALKLADVVPVPPPMIFLVKLDAERRAMAKKMDTVTPEIVRMTESGYRKTFGKEATEMVQAMLRGDDVNLPEEFFEGDEGELYKIEICPAKFGACTPDKRKMISDILVPLRKKVKELDLTRVVIESVRTPLMSHHVFRFSIIGCSNCCMSPYSSDFGIISLYKPGVKSDGCIKCKACLVPCIERAIDLENDDPLIDYNQCMMCGGCKTACMKDIIQTIEKGYKVVVGGTGSRHPRIAVTAAEFTDVQGVLSVIEKGIALFREKTRDKEMSFHEVIETYGVESLKSQA